MIDPIALTKRIPKGSGLTPGEGDQNWTDIETAVNGLNTGVSVFLEDDGTPKANVVTENSLKLEALSKGYLVDTGTANAWVVAISPTPANMAVLTGIPLHIKLAAGVTGATQLTVTGMGSAAVRFDGTTELRNGDYTTGQIVEVVSDGTVFQAKSQITPATVASTEKAIGSFRNLIFNRTTAAVCTITAAEAVLVNANGVHATFSAVSESADFGVADGPGGRETGLSAAAGWQYVWLLCKSDLTDLTAIFSASASTPNIGSSGLAAYANGYYLLVGMVYNSSSGSNLVAVYARDRQAWVNEAMALEAKQAAVADTYELLAGGDLTLFQSLVPPNAISVSGTIGSANASDNAKVTIAGDASGLGAVSCVSTSIADNVNPISSNGFNSACSFEIPLKTAQNFYWKSLETANRVRVTISGYRW
jgi:hypothetical protein